MSKEEKDIGKIIEEMLNRPLELIEENKKLKKKIEKLQKENKEFKKDISNMYNKEVVISIICDNFDVTRLEVLEMLGEEE